jgi:glycosyltransferase involved in cell wall biosynthesis
MTTIDLTGPVIGHVIVGPPEHGVVQFAERLADHLGGPVLRLGEVGAEIDPGVLAGVDVILMQYTDGLYGPDTATAAVNFGALRAQFRQPVAVTLHDLPADADDPVRYRRRATGYRAVRKVVEAVVVSSQHEARLLARFLTIFEAGHSAVVPLPVDVLVPASAERPDRRPELAVLGFIYPGKGHDEALDALDGLPPQIDFTAIGRAADGHDDLVTALAEAADEIDHRFLLTGFLPEAELLTRLREAAVPVAPNREVSASGSINTWIAAGRRPLVAAGPYTRELAERCPEAIHLYEPGELPELIHASFADPDLTWLDDGCRVGPSGTEAATAYRSLLAEVATRPLAGTTAR